MHQVGRGSIAYAFIVPAYCPYHMIFAIATFDNAGIAKQLILADCRLNYGTVIEHSVPVVALFAVGIMQAIAPAFKVAKQVNTIRLGLQRSCIDEHGESCY